jgi:uncharacterized membrane protein YeiB
MLLLIASANVWGYLYGRPTGAGWRPDDGAGVDRVVDGVVAFLVDDRARPVFAVLYGFGIATMAARLVARGVAGPGVRAVLRRRSLWLVVLGLLHATLLFGGDILGAYGVTGLVALALVHRPRRVLLRWFWGSTALMTTVAGLITFGALGPGGGGDEVEMPPTGYLAAVPERLVDWAINTAGSGLFLFFVPPVVLGILLARAGWLTGPREHRTVLARVGVAGMVVNLLNLPFALTVARVWTPDEPTAGVLRLVHDLSGIPVGLGYVCLFAWAAAALGERRSRAVDAVAAVGRRSLTSYLLQSVMLAPLLSAWGLGLGAVLGSAQAAAVAVLVWLVTVALAVAMERAGRSGPFEVLLRRLGYGRR